eukprot:CAMPEP_0204155586 /NCGR_PEP_ID=MMETSP0361-20130328/29732_1 /ASSEMBLY_ACC=CAM_ASM_000343 /TAXON_ID=268821 /ORGANISM="Scrippsiella Hangoei, Strain SHTV-5" /LENGTH=197 /DNA_ID=CAMNT_0051111103 /DNA_START=165 /DNA_END=755 /DNA_ORIENTATION=+
MNFQSKGSITGPVSKAPELPNSKSDDREAVKLRSVSVTSVVPRYLRSCNSQSVAPAADDEHDHAMPAQISVLRWAVDPPRVLETAGVEGCAAEPTSTHACAVPRSRVPMQPSGPAASTDSVASSARLSSLWDGLQTPARRREPASGCLARTRTAGGSSSAEFDAVDAWRRASRRGDSASTRRAMTLGEQLLRFRGPE